MFSLFFDKIISIYHQKDIFRIKIGIKMYY